MKQPLHSRYTEPSSTCGPAPIYQNQGCRTAQLSLRPGGHPSRPVHTLSPPLMSLRAAAFWFCLPFLYIEAIGPIQSCHSVTLSWAAVEICWANKGIQQNPAKSPSVLAAWQWIACEKQAGWCFQKHSAVDLSCLGHGWMQKPNVQTEESQRLSHLPCLSNTPEQVYGSLNHCLWGFRGEERGFGYVRKKK